AVHHGEGFFGDERNGFEAFFLQPGRGRHHLAVHAHFALTCHGCCHVGKRGEVAACADGSFGGDDGVDAMVEHIYKAFRDLSTHTALTLCEGLNPCCQHRCAFEVGEDASCAAAVKT